MNKLTAITVCSLACVFGTSAFAQTTAPSAPPAPAASATQAEMVKGWGVKHNLIGKSVMTQPLTAITRTVVQLKKIF